VSSDFDMGRPVGATKRKPGKTVAGKGGKSGKSEVASVAKKPAPKPKKSRQVINVIKKAAPKSTNNSATPAKKKPVAKKPATGNKVVGKAICKKGAPAEKSGVVKPEHTVIPTKRPAAVQGSKIGIVAAAKPVKGRSLMSQGFKEARREKEMTAKSEVLQWTATLIPGKAGEEKGKFGLGLHKASPPEAAVKWLEVTSITKGGPASRAVDPNLLKVGDRIVAVDGVCDKLFQAILASGRLGKNCEITLQRPRYLKKDVWKNKKGYDTSGFVAAWMENP